MVNNFLFVCVCVCVLLVTWRANGIVLYMYEGKVLMDKKDITGTGNNTIKMKTPKRLYSA